MFKVLSSSIKNSCVPLAWWAPMVTEFGEVATIVAVSVVVQRPGFTDIRSKGFP